MTIQLTPEQERILREALREGRFGSVEDALAAALQSIASPPAAGHRRTPAEAAARLRELRKGNFLPPGMTIRGLLDQGRA
jgi:Arc/MetJ-type ribon-helix-helix transcriptional regulator